MILVTGGAGYVGSHYVLHAREAGEEVVVLDDLRRGHREAVGDVPLVVGDVGDRACLDGIFAAHRVEAVVHFAAYAYVGESVTEPGLYFRNNVGSTLTLLEAMRDHQVDKIVFSSSCVVFGNPVRVPIDESHPREPVSPYGESKLFCERMLAAFDVAHGIRSTALRYFNAAGADERGRTGETHDPETHLLPLVLQAATGRQPALRIFGDDWETPDGTCVRDYVHVADLAAAHGLALQRLRGGASSRAFNLGSERGHSVREVVAACEKVTGKRVETQVTARRAGDPPKLVASAERARTELGWQPRFTDLERIVATAWAWEQHRRF
ncbi:MAG: UDP-glucose 4-epimerase GalE [Polyangiaceae bacterium]